MKLDAIGIVSQNLKESVQFYRLLGLHFPEATGDHLEAQATGGLRIMLDSEELMKSMNPAWVKPVGQRIALAFLCDSPKQVDEVFKKVTTAGYKGSKEPWDAFWGQRYASVVDPDGNSVDLFAPL
jgi:uncharacterized glyoxalase superfamily protein PhnB